MYINYKQNRSQKKLGGSKNYSKKATENKKFE